MQVSAGQDGIQRLLAAEQEAQKIVAKARKGQYLHHQGHRNQYMLVCISSGSLQPLPLYSAVQTNPSV